MGKINKAITLLKNNRRKLATSILMQMNQLFSDELYLKLLFRLNLGYRLDLKKPKTFSEKLQWLKLYNRNPNYTILVDKYLVKDHVAGIIGTEHIIPTLGVWDRVEEIAWDSLPKRFVLKTTHGGGNTGVVICNNKDTLDKNEAIRKLKQSLKEDIYKQLREWPYKNVQKRIIAEQYIEPSPNTNDLPDYKWYCFNGEPKFCQLIQDRNTKETIDFYDINWVHQDFIGLNPVDGPFVKFADYLAPCPSDLDTQIMIAKKLSYGIPYSRVDLYSIGGKTYFGEITFYPMSGMGKFAPEEWNYKLGEMLILPK